MITKLYYYIVPGMGTYRWIRASYYVVLARRHELEERKEEFASHKEFIEAVRSKPEDLKIYTRMIHRKPDDWDEELFGIFPPSGIMAVGCKLPSAHKSMKSKQFFKHTFLFLCKPEERNNLLFLQDELMALFGYCCNTDRRVMDVCSRMMATG